MATNTRTWLEWTKYISGYNYPDTRQLSEMTSNGEAYGRYGYRYDKDLVPFMQFCRTTSTYYDCFIPYINLGVGNQQLVSNTDLRNLLFTLTQENPTHFGWCQNQYFYNTYLSIIVSDAYNQGVSLANYFKINAALSSFALRDGLNGVNTQNAINEMITYDGNVNNMLSHSYAVFITAYAGIDGPRWYTQWIENRDIDLMFADKIDTDEPAKPVQPTPPPVPPQPSVNNFWHLWFDTGLFLDY